MITHLGQYQTVFLYFFAVLFFSYFLSKLFIKFWQILFNNGITPTGIGISLPFLLLAYFPMYSDNAIAPIFLPLVIFFSALYFLDDLYGLSPIFRIFLVVIFSLCSVQILEIDALNGLVKNHFVFYVLIFLFIFFFLNVINFYDGADLNSAFLLGLFSINLMLLVPVESDLFIVAIIFLGFACGFGAINRFPNKLYFGDAGAFSFAALLCFIVYQLFDFHQAVIAVLFIPFALPVTDVILTLVYRVWKRENLLGRHYHHLYHRLQKEAGGKSYLLPQLVNFLVCHVSYNLCFKNESSYFFEVLSFMITVSFFNYVMFMLFCVRNYKHG